MTDVQIFMKAPADASAEELKAYLDEACGDDAALRTRVESLLQADASAGRFMSAPCTLLDEESSSPVIDRYKLLQEIGESHTKAVEEHGAFGVPTYIFPSGGSAFIKMFIPPDDQAGEIYSNLTKLVSDLQHVGEIKRPQPPWPHGVI